MSALSPLDIGGEPSLSLFLLYMRVCVYARARGLIQMFNLVLTKKMVVLADLRPLKGWTIASVISCPLNHLP